MSEPADRSYREQRAIGRQLGSPGQGVRLVRLDVLRPGQVAETRREQLVREEHLQSALPGLPRCLSQHTDAHQLTFIFEQPQGRHCMPRTGLRRSLDLRWTRCWVRCQEWSARSAVCTASASRTGRCTLTC
ncbi:hypothetical protein ACFQ1L_01275 [Phytohabitans flavus]|uniref:hypothetical protein n=1 Tax=Phytohabitans flavus TaxID=1076124 RepID=UPI00362637D6